MIISNVFGLLSILVIAAPELNDVKMDVNYKDVMRALKELPIQEQGRIAAILLSAIALAIVAYFVLIITIYAALTIGHLASSHRGLISVAVAFALLVCELVIAEKVIDTVGFTGRGAMEIVIPLLVGAAMFAGLFLLTDYLMRNKLNLE